MRIDQNTTLEEIVADPKKFGLPTYEEYLKNPNLMPKNLSAFDSVDNGPQRLLKQHIQRVRYLWKGYYFDKLEQVEKAITSDGHNPLDLDYQPELIPQGGGKCDVLVRFVVKGQESKDAARTLKGS